MIEKPCFLDKDKNIFAFKGEISKAEINKSEINKDEINLFSEDYKHQKTHSQNSKQFSCLDLHNCNLKIAEEKLQEFILFCNEKRIKKIKIITGKGIHSGERGPVIRNFILDYLENHPNIKWKFAPPKRGGIGVFELKIP